MTKIELERRIQELETALRWFVHGNWWTRLHDEDCPGASEEPGSIHPEDSLCECDGLMQVEQVCALLKLEI